MSGRYFDEWKVGDTVAHAITRTITETDNLLISTLTHNPQPLHIDAEAAKASEFGQILVNSCLTFSLVVALLNIGGAICLLVGLLVTIPITLMASVYVYRQLSPKQEATA